jgi:hypothetical protein
MSKKSEVKQIVEYKPAPRNIELNTTSPNVIEYTKALPPFTGMARSVQCFDNSGHRNYRILTFEIVDDVIVKTTYSDPYAQFEAISKLDHWNDTDLIHLNNVWEDKKTLHKNDRKTLG